MTQSPRKELKPCKAYIIHGAGHQSTTYCQKKGKHKKHEAIYGRCALYKEWTGKQGSSGMDDQ